MHITTEPKVECLYDVSPLASLLVLHYQAYVSVGLMNFVPPGNPPRQAKDKHRKSMRTKMLD